MSDELKLSDKIHKVITSSISNPQGQFYRKDWKWVEENSYFAEFYKDALELERYIEAWHRLHLLMKPDNDALRAERDQAEGELAVLRKMHNITKKHSELLHENSWLWEKMKFAEECIDKGSAQVKQLQSERDRAREMIARLIEAGEILHATIADIDYERHAYPCLAWHALVAEWQANQKGDSNV